MPVIYPGLGLYNSLIMMTNTYISGVVILLFSVGCNLEKKEKIVSSVMYQDSYNSPYDVRPDYRSKTNYSPKLKNDSIGLDISVPLENTFRPGNEVDDFGSFIYIPLSITYSFSLAYESKFDNLTDHMAVIAVNTVTGESYSATLKNDDEVENQPSDLSHISEYDMNNTISTGYLTINLIHYLDLPEEEAIYNLHVTLEEFQSSTVVANVKVIKD